MATTWTIAEDGMIGQSLSDIQDLNSYFFTEAAKHHNQKIKDAKEKK